MDKILLISVDNVKDMSSISDNMTPKYLRPAILQAQEQGLMGIVGECLYDKLLEVADRAIKNEQTVDDKPYIDLINQSSWYLADLAIVNVIPRISYKVANSGVETTDEERARQTSYNEMVSEMNYYTNQVDYQCKLLQNYILRNKDRYPELDECQCNRIKSNLYSSATCGIWLGGRRGKRRRNLR